MISLRTYVMHRVFHLMGYFLHFCSKAKAFRPDDSDEDSDDDYSDDEDLQSPIDEIDPFVFFVDTVKGEGPWLVLDSSFLVNQKSLVFIGMVLAETKHFPCFLFQNFKSSFASIRSVEVSEPDADARLPLSGAGKWRCSAR